MIKDHYKTLELNRNASINEIKKAYRKLALKWHPDVNNNKNAHNLFIEINEAYLILTDAEARRKYDNEYDYNFRIPKSSQPVSSTADSVNKSDNRSKYEDEDLNRWSQNAKNQAESYASMSFERFSKMVNLIIKETSIQAGKALLYAISGIVFADGIFSLIIGIRDKKPDKIFLSVFFILLSIVGLSIISKKYNK